MTREEILALPAGRVLDALVAEQILGCKVDRKNVPHFARCNCSKDHPHGTWNAEAERREADLEAYSWSMDAVWQLVENLTETTPTDPSYFDFRLTRRPHGYEAGFQDMEGRWFEALADVAPPAICRAALLAKLPKVG